MPRFKVNPKMYVIPNNGDFILYSPLTGSILDVTSGIVKELQNISFGKKYKYGLLIRIIELTILMKDTLYSMKVLQKAVLLVVIFAH